MKEISLANELMEEGLVDEALAVIREVRKHSDDETLYLIAELLEEWGFVDQAIEVCEGLLKTHQGDSDLITKLASLYIDNGTDERAIALLNEVGPDDPAYVYSLLLLADLYQTQGLYEVSEQKLLTAKNLMPEEIIIDFALGELLFSIGEYQRAIVFYQRVYREETEMNYISIIERLAECYAFIGEYEEALHFFKKQTGDHPDILFKYGYTASQVYRYELAISIWRKLLEIDPYYHTVYFELANALMKEALPNDAYEIAKQGLEIDEHNKQLFFIAGKLAYELNELNEAKAYLEEAIALDHDYKEALLLLINIYKATGATDKIIQLLNNIIKIGANDAQYYWELGRAYYEMELYDEALEAYEEAHHQLQHDSDFLKEYGFILIEEGQNQAAVTVFKRYLQFVPEDDEVIELIGRFIDLNYE